MILLSPRTRFVVVAGVIAVATRLAAAKPVLSVVAVGGVALGAVAVGYWWHGRDHAREWRRAWILLAAGLLVLVFGSLAGAVSDAGPASFPTAVEPLALLGQGLTVTALFALLRQRLPGRALDILFEGVTIAVAVGFVVWALAIEPATAATPGPGVKVLALVFPLVDLVALWLMGRLIFLSDDHPSAYRYLLGALLCLCTVHAVTAGSVLQNWSPARAELNALMLWSYCLWGAGGLHPSLRLRFDPVPSRPSTGLGRGHLALVVGALLVGPAVIALQAARGLPLHLPVVLPGSMLMPLLTAAHLLYQVRERAGAEYRAQHDPLTGLPNRVLFYDRVTVALAHAHRHETGFAVMFLDLDRFKGVNDSLGHGVGNQLLQAVANRLRQTLRAEDTVARMGGDEFTLLIPEVSSPLDCEVVADKVLRAFSEPFLIGTRELFVSTSIGIANAPSDGSDVETLLKHADTAMYRAKAKGRNAYHFFTSDMSARAELKHALESSLRAAIERGELELHYQPKIDLRNTRVVGLEALVRWRHPKLGLLSPGTFIPLAEETGLIVPLGEWVLEAACHQLRQWTEEGLTPVPVAVNISARQFEQQRIEELVTRVLEKTGVDPQLLEIELTESVFLQDIATTRTTLKTLQAMGVRCAIDDFGTGFSGLNYLAEMPIDSLKIDQSFVQKISSATDEAPIVGAIIALAHSLRMNVVAEGVETAEQARFLQDHGCEQMQGFYFSRPLPAGDIMRVVFPEGDEDAPGGLAGIATTQLYPVPSLALSASQATSLLYALCSDDDSNQFEPAQVAAILTALQLDDYVAPWGQRLWRSASVRLAVGTFAGLMPLSSGLAAAGALPAPAQQLASTVLSPVGVTIPIPEHWKEHGRGTGAGGSVPGPQEERKSKGRRQPDPGRKDRPAEGDHGRPEDKGAPPGQSGSIPGQDQPQPKKDKPHPEHPLGERPGNPEPGPVNADPEGGAHPEHPLGAPPGNPDPGPPPQAEPSGNSQGDS